MLSLLEKLRGTYKHFFLIEKNGDDKTNTAFDLYNLDKPYTVS